MQISDEMVEKAAEAIFTTWAQNRGVSENWAECTHLHHSIVDEAREEARAALTAALAGHVVVPVEPTPAMLRRGSAMKLDTAMAPGHPGLKENGGKYSRFELMSLETWQEMLRAHGGDDAGK